MVPAVNRPSVSRPAARSPQQGLPTPVAVFGFIGLALLAVPLLALLAQAPYSQLWSLLSDSQTVSSIKVSLVVSLSAAAISVILGVPLAFVLARGNIPGRTLLRTIVTVPLVLPPVVTGVALLSGFGRSGLLGRVFGLQLPFTTVGAILAATTVAMPFLVLSVEGALRSVDPRFEQMAATLGAGPLARWWHVALPTIRPAIIAGAVLAWARALGEFGATITFAGNLPGVTQTLPLDIAVAFEQNPDRARALSLLMLVVAMAVLVGLRDRWVPRR